MILRRFFISLLFFGWSLTSLSAQDIHYSLHNMAPLWLNPANTGAFYGSVRASGIYRGQWHGFSGISTPSISIDAPVIKGLRKQDWIGAGFLLVSDNAGSNTEIITNITGMSASYHFSLDKKQRSVLTLGAQYGSVSIALRAGNCGIQQINIEEGLGGGGGTGCETFIQGGGGNNSGNRPGRNNDSKTNYTDINAGLMFRTKLDPKGTNAFEIGLAMLHINQDDYRSLIDNMNPDTTGLQIGSNSIDSRRRKGTIHGHASLDYELSDKLRFMPTLFYQSSAQNSSASIQAWMGTPLKNNMLFKFGLGYRTGDAGKLLVGIEKDRLRVAASYDVPLSQLTPTSNLRSVNSFELAANYIFNITKQPAVKQNILCPQI